MSNLEKYIEDIMVTFPDVNQSHRRMMQKVGYHQQKKIDELRESLKVCQRDYNSMIRLLNGLDNIAVRDCIGRMNLRKAMFKKSLEEKETQGE